MVDGYTPITLAISVCVWPRRRRCEIRLRSFSVNGRPFFRGDSYIAVHLYTKTAAASLWAAQRQFSSYIFFRRPPQVGEDEPGKRAGPVRPALPSPRGEGLADRIETRRHGKVLHCRDPPVGDVWARFCGGSCRQYGACAPYPLLYSLFAAMSNTAICALCISAAPGCFAGVRVTGAIM